MPEFLVLALCGALGASMYAFPILIKALTAIPPGRFAWLSLAFSVIVGACSAPILTPFLGNRWDFLISPEPYPLAVGIGLAINPIAPIVVNRLTKWAEGFNIGPKA